MSRLILGNFQGAPARFPISMTGTPNPEHYPITLALAEWILLYWNTKGWRFSSDAVVSSSGGPGSFDSPQDMVASGSNPTTVDQLALLGASGSPNGIQGFVCGERTGPLINSTAGLGLHFNSTGTGFEYDQVGGAYKPAVSIYMRLEIDPTFDGTAVLTVSSVESDIASPTGSFNAQFFGKSVECWYEYVVSGDGAASISFLHFAANDAWTW